MLFVLYTTHEKDIWLLTSLPVGGAVHVTMKKFTELGQYEKVDVVIPELSA